MQKVDLEYVVIGAGVIGLAIARLLALNGKDVYLLEKNAQIGEGISSRNSEVIHAGIYYPQDSLKARLCVRGKHLLYEYCQRHAIGCDKKGKLIVAGDQLEQQRLMSIQEHAVRNGVDDIRFLAQSEINELEPALSSVAALFSPSTGIVDSHGFMLQLQADYERAGGQCVFNTEIEPLVSGDNGIVLVSRKDDMQIRAKVCINACGLGAVAFAKALIVGSLSSSLNAFYAKGSYFSYQSKVPFKHLIYPVPVHGGLGVHLTLDLQGRAKFGPDVEWLKASEPFDYRVPEHKRDVFYRAVKRYWPLVEESKLLPDYAGIRPKLSGPDEAAADFMIQGESEHGIPGLINVLGIESPGLTASLAIAEYVADHLGLSTELV